MTQAEVFDKIVEFFFDRFLQLDKWERFEEELRKSLASPTEQYLSLYVDYDPQGELLNIVRASGIECAGFMFSADGIFGGTKFGVEVDYDRGVARFKRGYGDTGFSLYW